MDAPAEWAQHAQAPVTDLVAEALDHDRAVGRDDAGRVLLVSEELDEVGGRLGVEVVLPLQGRGVLADRPPGEGTDRLAELLRPLDGVALPERHRARQPGSRRDDHPIAADLLDPPGAGPEEEGLARARLVDHLLVELAHAAAVRERDRVQPAVWDRPRVRDRQLPRARPGPDR